MKSLSTQLTYDSDSNVYDTDINSINGGKNGGIYNLASDTGHDSNIFDGGFASYRSNYNEGIDMNNNGGTFSTISIPDYIRRDLLAYQTSIYRLDKKIISNSISNSLYFALSKCVIQGDGFLIAINRFIFLSNIYLI